MIFISLRKLLTILHRFDFAEIKVLIYKIRDTLLRRVSFLRILSELYYLNQFNCLSSLIKMYPLHEQRIKSLCQAFFRKRIRGSPLVQGFPSAFGIHPLRSVSKARLSAVCGRRAGTLSHAPCKPLKRLDLNFYYAEGSCVSVLQALYYLKQFSKWSSLMLANL